MTTTHTTESVSTAMRDALLSFGIRPAVAEHLARGVVVLTLSDEIDLATAERVARDLGFPTKRGRMFRLDVYVPAALDLASAAAVLAADLLRMHDSGALDLATWPAARALIAATQQTPTPTTR